MWRDGRYYRDTWITGFNIHNRPLHIWLALVVDGIGPKNIEVTAAPRSRWAVNLGAPEHGILQPGRLVNIGGDMSCDGPCTGSVAVWNDSDYSRASSFMYQLDEFICKEQ